MDVKLKYIVEDGELLQSFDRLHNLLGEMKDGFKDADKVQDKFFKEMGKDISAANKAVEKVVQNIKGFSEETKVAKKESGIFRQIINGIGDALEDSNTKLGEVIKNYRGKQKALKDTAKGLENSGKELKKFNSLLRANLIGFVVNALRSLVGLLQKTESGMKLVSGVTSVLESVFATIVKRADSLFQTFKSLVSLDFSGAFDNAKKTFSGLGTELIKNGKAAIELQNAQDELVKSERRLSKEIATRTKRIEELNAVIEDETKSSNERQRAAIEKAKIENELEQKRLKLSKENLALIEARKKAGTASAAELNDAQIQVLESEARQAQVSRQNALQLRELRQRAADERNKQLQAEAKEIETLSKQYEKLAKQITNRVQDAQLSSLNGEDRIERERQIALAEIAELEKVAKEKAKAINKEFELEKEFAELRKAVNQNADKEITNFRVEESKKRLSEKNAALDAEIKNIDQLKEISLQEIELIKEGTDKTLSLEQEKEKKRLEIKIKAANQQLNLLKGRFGKDSPEVKLLEVQILQFQQSINDLGNTDLSTLDRFKEKLFKSLGLTEKDKPLFEFALNQATEIFNQIGKNFTANIDAQLEGNQRLIDAINQRISETQNALNRELQLKQAGYANDYALEKERLENLQKEREKAEKERAKLEAQANRRRLLADAASQVSSLATGAANIIKAESNKGLLGVALAIAGIATIFKIFSQAKANAAKSVDIPKFRHGTDYVEGAGSHTSDSVPALLSRGERVIKWEDNKKLLDAGITNELLAPYAIFGKQMMNLPRFEPITNFGYMNHAVQSINRLNEEKAKLEAQYALSKKDIAEAVEKGVEKKLNELIRTNRERPHYLSEGNYMEKKTVGNTIFTKKIKV